MEKLFSNNMKLLLLITIIYFIPSERAAVVLRVDDTPTQYNM